MNAYTIIYVYILMYIYMNDKQEKYYCNKSIIIKYNFIYIILSQGEINDMVKWFEKQVTKKIVTIH